MAKYSLNHNITIRVLIPLMMLILIAGMISKVPIYLECKSKLDQCIGKMIDNQRTALQQESSYLAMSGSTGIVQYASNLAMLMGASQTRIFAYNSWQSIKLHRQTQLRQWLIIQHGPGVYVLLRPADVRSLQHFHLGAQRRPLALRSQQEHQG